MPSTLRLDLPFRFQRALQPDGLRVMQTCSAALTDALNDARRAGCNPETDPAVLLLGRHLGRVAAGECPEAGHPEDDDLRKACEQRIAELKSAPILVPLIQRGLGCDPDLIRVYKSTAREALRYLAHTLCLDPANYNIQLDRHFTADNPAISLFADRFCVTIDPCRINPGREIGWVRTNGRDGPWAGGASCGAPSISSPMSPASLQLSGATATSTSPPEAGASEGIPHGMALNAALEHAPLQNTQGVSRCAVHLRTPL